MWNVLALIGMFTVVATAIVIAWAIYESWTHGWL